MSPAPLYSKHKFSQTGQGILEVIVTIGIGTIMILALVVLATRTNRSADFSKASSEASSLATEGLEVIQYLINSNSPSYDVASLQGFTLTDCNTLTESVVTSFSGVGTGYTNWDTFWLANIQDELCTTGTYVGPYGRFAVLHSANSSPARSNELHIAVDAVNTSELAVKINNITFYRQVSIADSPYGVGNGKSKCNIDANDYKFIKQFTVQVSWTDTTGTHSQVQSRCIRR